MNKNIVILSIIFIISMFSISSVTATNNDNVEKDNNTLEALWNKFVETISYIFTHDPLDYNTEEIEEVINDIENDTLNEMNMTNITAHNIHEENTTIISEETNNSHIKDKSESSNVNKSVEIKS